MDENNCKGNDTPDRSCSIHLTGLWTSRFELVKDGKALEFMGSIPAGCWAFFFHYPQYCVLTQLPRGGATLLFILKKIIALLCSLGQNKLNKLRLRSIKTQIGNGGILKISVFLDPTKFLRSMPRRLPRHKRGWMRPGPRALRHRQGGLRAVASPKLGSSGPPVG